MLDWNVKMMIIGMCDLRDWVNWLSVSKRLQKHIHENLLKKKRLFYAFVQADMFQWEGHHVGIFNTLHEAQQCIKDKVHLKHSFYVRTLIVD